MTGSTPPRGFPEDEFEDRTAKAQELMAQQGISALLVTTEPEVRYLSGFTTQFWQSPTRPWFLVIPAKGKPVAVIPEIGRICMGRTWVDDIRTWDSPHPDDDGIGLLADTLKELTEGEGQIGIPMGRETHMRLPLGEFELLKAALAPQVFSDAAPIVVALREIKSEREIEKIARTCAIGSDAFEALPDRVEVGMTEVEIYHQLKQGLYEFGADDVPFIALGAGQNGYRDIISAPTERPSAPGDIFILDTGAVRDGYFCDFDRNYAIGDPSDEAKRVNDILFDATQAGINAARPGVSMADLFNAMVGVMEEAGFAPGEGVGRMGHGLGMQLTEWPSIVPHDPAVLKPNMVMTIEPGLVYGDGLTMVHEENILIQDGPPKMLSRRAARELPVIK